MHRILAVGLAVIGISVGGQAAEFHVAVNGNDTHSGSATAPFRTIQHGADLAQPGDVITVHAGTYRERISPPRGGDSDARRIVYQAAPGETVEIKGSEIVTNWVHVQGDVWAVTLSNSFFGTFNPYSDLIHGDWFLPRKRQHHTGAVYLNGEWLLEAASKEAILKPLGSTPLWFGEVDKECTTIWAQFKGVNPNEQVVEINVRRTVFYPEKTGRNYITVRGFNLRHAATPWAPPTAEQIGLIGTHWSKGWIIENNVISHSACSGVALGKYGDAWDNRAGSAQGYVGTISRALSNGWSRATIGSHIVRNNTISHCEQAGIVGSLGAVFSTIIGNTIHDIHVRKLFGGAEQAGIKIHGAIDVEISRNHVYRTCRGLWLDWMAQGTRVSGNCLHDNELNDLFVEVNHGPFLVDNNIFLSRTSVENWSQGGAYVHNLVTGKVNVKPYEGRVTPFLQPHATGIAGMHDNPFGDDRYYNNIFLKNADLSQYDKVQHPVGMGGNVYLNGAKPSRHEPDPLVRQDAGMAVRLLEKQDGFCLEMTYGKGWLSGGTPKLVTSDLLGKVVIPNAPYEQPDGTPVRIGADYVGKPRNEANPTPGPFETPGEGLLQIKIW